MKLSEFTKHPLALEHAWFTDTLPRFLAQDWQQVKVPPLGDSKVPTFGYHHESGLTVVITGDREQDGRRWITLTLVCADRAPVLSEIISVKDLFIGNEYAAVMRLPKVSERAHPNVVHLFRCIDADGMTPDFTRRAKEASRIITL